MKFFFLQIFTSVKFYIVFIYLITRCYLYKPVSVGSIFVTEGCYFLSMFLLLISSNCEKVLCIVELTLNLGLKAQAKVPTGRSKSLEKRPKARMDYVSRGGHKQKQIKRRKPSLITDSVTD